MTKKILLNLGFFGVFLGCLVSISACGSDSSSSPGDDLFSSNSQGNNSAASNEGKDGSSSGSTTNSSSSNASSKQESKTETVSSKEALLPESKKVNGTCGTTTGKIGKGEIATWKFYRNEGSIIEQIMSPFKWSFTGGKTESLQGNGMDTVNVRYEDAGTVTATLIVDGNEVKCEPLQVQGIPITIKSCGPTDPKMTSIKAGQTISWTVEAESESKITGYSWSSDFGTVSGNGASATLAATADMHKKSVTATVSVTNDDKTTEVHTCEGVTVLDPEVVDLVLALGSINDKEKYDEPLLPSLPNSAFVQGQTPMTVQVPSGAPTNCTIGCKPRLGADYDSMKLTWDGEVQSNPAYFNPAGCAPGKKYSVEATVTVICVVNSQ